MENSRDIDPIETREWLDSLRRCDRGRRASEGALSLRKHDRRRAPTGRAGPILGEDPLSEHNSSREAGDASWQPSDRTPSSLDHPLERDGDGFAGQQAILRARRSHRQLPVVRDCSTTPASSISGMRVAENHGGDLIYIQGHVSPGIYARAFLEGRLTEEHLQNFRQEVDGNGLSSYPHPWLMPDFWQFPTVSMGLGPLMAIYQARFLKYLHARGFADTANAQGLGVSRRRRNGRAGIARRDHAGRARKARQPDLRHQLQSAAARRAGARQRQDHPGTRRRSSAARAGTSSRSSGDRVGTTSCQGHKRRVAARAWTKRRRRISGIQVEERRLHPPAFLRQISRNCRDGRRLDRRSDLGSSRAAATIPHKVYAAYKAAIEHKGQPTVILAKTVKGYGMGEAGEGQNIAHQQKKMDEKRCANSATGSSFRSPTRS